MKCIECKQKIKESDCIDYVANREVHDNCYEKAKDRIHRNTPWYIRCLCPICDVL